MGWTLLLSSLYNPNRLDPAPHVFYWQETVLVAAGDGAVECGVTLCDVARVSGQRTANVRSNFRDGKTETWTKDLAAESNPFVLVHGSLYIIIRN